MPSASCFLRVLQGVSALEVEAITRRGQDQVLGPNPDPLVASEGKTLKRRVRDRTSPTWREWNSGRRWHMIRQVVD